MKVAGAVALVTALALAGCAQPAPNGAPRSELIAAQQREPASLNPALENGTSATQWGELLFQYLVRFDERGLLTGDAAREVPTLANGGISRDGRTITYHLRKGLRWADGQPLTAHDCVWSIDAINDPRNDAQSREGYDQIHFAQATDDTTLVLHLRRPYAPLLVTVLAPQGYPILPQHLLKRYHDFNHITFDGMPVGSGPYVVTRWARGDRIEMRANPYYAHGKPKIDHLQINFVPDWHTAINLLHTREVDALFNVTDLSDYPLLAALPGIHAQLTPVGATGTLIFNTRDAVVGDVRVRHALAEAIDVASLVRKTFHGAFSSAQAARGLFLWAYDPRAFPDAPYDPAHARALLERAGWRAGADGLRRKDGKPLEVLLVNQSASSDDAIMANAIVQYERAIGVVVTVKSYAIAQLVAPAAQGGPVYGGKFGIVIFDFVNGDDPDTTDQFACAAVPPHGYNKSRFCDPQADALLAQGQASFDPVRRKAIYARLQRILARELPLMPLYQRRELDAYVDRLHGQTTSLDFAWWNAGAWTLTRRRPPR